MPIDFSNQLYLQAQATFGRPVTFYPKKSQPLVESYEGRGIFDTEPMDDLLEGQGTFSDQRTILDIREDEFTVTPIQGDELDIPAVGNLRARGRFRVSEVKANGGGEVSLELSKVVVNKPA